MRPARRIFAQLAVNYAHFSSVGSRALSGRVVLDGGRGGRDHFGLRASGTHDVLYTAAGREGVRPRVRWNAP